jgi:methylisocitrate lyase
MSNTHLQSAGATFRAAVAAEQPLQVVGAITAYAACWPSASASRPSTCRAAASRRIARPAGPGHQHDGRRADRRRRITDACDLPLLVDIDTGWGGAFNIARTVRSLIKFGVAAVHIEDQVGAEALRPPSGQGSRPQEEMVDRMKAAVDARTDDQFVIMARTDAAAVEGLDARSSARSPAWKPAPT